MTISLIFCFGLIIILSICILFLIIIYLKLRQNYEALENSHRNLDRFNSELRSQRHDYLNHLQVVYGLIQLGEYGELQKYFEPVQKDIQKTGKALRTSKPAINALLKAKMDEAEKRDIDFYIEVKSDLSGIQVEDWELCKVISNIVDNAMTALDLKEDNRRITMEISESKEKYEFSIANNGPKIPEEMHRTIFKQGFTSKKEAGHGMGLYIVKNIMTTYNGTMTLTSTDEETVFGFSFPKKEGEMNG